MIKAMNSKAYESIRQGMKEGMDIAWKQGKDGMETAWKQGRRVHFRSPWTYDRPGGWRSSGWVGLALLSLAAMAVGAWLYLRKRKEEADRFPIAEGARQPWTPAETQVDGKVAATAKP